MSEQTDVIELSQIKHSIDEVWCGEQLAQRYNYLGYHLNAMVRIAALHPMRTISSLSFYSDHSRIDRAFVASTVQR